jgi:UDP-N-acetylmuramate--alanine ligase
MKSLDYYTSVYCIGIGGIGMSAIARYFNASSKQVFGYDRTSTSLTQELEAEGIQIFDTLETSHLERFNANNCLVVYTAAIPNDHPLLSNFRTRDFECLKRSRILGKITSGKPTLAVAGTHGKTTTSAILAHLLHEAEINFTGFLGGVVNNFKSNYISTGHDLFVVEADEFDRSFMQLKPTKACIIAKDPDHLDIYETDAEFDQTFNDFANLIQDKSDLFLGPKVKLDGVQLTVDAVSNFSISHIKIHNGVYIFDFKLGEIQLQEIKSNLPGLHNCINSALALALAITSFPEHARVFANAIGNFKGIKRRFNKVVDTAELVVIDDYAHHPTEIKAVHDTLSSLYPDLNLSVIFQPHLFTRTRDFKDQFVEQLKQFDQVFLLDIYPAREEPIKDVNAAALVQAIGSKARLITKAEIKPIIEHESQRVVACLGAGDIGVEVQKLTQKLSQNA